MSLAQSVVLSILGSACCPVRAGSHGSSKGVEAPLVAASFGDVEAWSCERIEGGGVLS